MATPSIVLYGHPVSWLQVISRFSSDCRQADAPTQSVQIVLAERNIPHEFKKVEFQEKQPEWYTKVNPQGDFPVLVCGETVIRGLEVMCEFVDETGLAGVKLMSEDPISRARTRMALRVWEACCSKLFTYIESPEDELKMKRTEALKQLKKMEACYTEEAKQENIEDGAFFLGNNLSMVDVIVAPSLIRFQAAINRYREEDILEDYPKLAKMVAEAKKNRSLKETSLSELKMAVSLKSHFKNLPKDKDADVELDEEEKEEDVSIEI